MATGINSSFRVLIVDDDRELCRDLSGTVADAGYQVECRNGGDGLFSTIRDIAPDLVIIDISVPGTEALEILRRLKNHRQTKKIPVIVTSRQAELEYELLDVFDFLPKPIDRSRLMDDLAYLSSRRRRGESLPELALSKEDLGLFQDFLVTHSGLHFDRRNIKLLERGLIRRMRAVHVESFRAYFDYLQKYEESRQELKKLLGLLTVGETYFFRYLPHFEALVQYILPEFILRNRHRRRLRIWSAGCSSGEEAYTLAMVLTENFPELIDWDVRILATDINKRSLRQAREAVYRPRALRVTDSGYKEKYFRQFGSSYVLDPRIRDMVRFAYLNLQTGVFPSEDNGTEDLDLLFCRNVMIYFRLSTTRRIVERFHRCLRPGGYLFLGHAETLMNISDQFQRVHNAGGFYYRAKESGEEPEVPPLRRMPSLPPPPPPRRPAREEVPGPVPRPRRETPEPEPSSPESRAPSAAAQSDVEEIYQRAVQAFNREDFQTAALEYEEILQVQPDHLGALIGKGFICANRGASAEALDFCSRALAVDDLCAEAYFLRGLIRELDEDLPAAVNEYRKALLLNMDFIMPHYNLCKVFWRLERYRDARRELKNTLNLLENAPDESLIAYSGGLSRAVFLEVCREDAMRFEEIEATMTGS